MSLKKLPELHAFLSTYFAEADAESDEQTAKAFAASASAEKRQQVADQAMQLIESGGLSTEELGIEANRWFAGADEARAWLERIAGFLQDGQASDAAPVKDSNGTVLSEGDSVQVIKDLKVKGGSSDLKRGTLIKKIRLIGDPENIECRVDGSTLVLKTCFLKKV